jgi:hypothetical protein
LNCEARSLDDSIWDGATGLTAGTPPEGIGKVRNFTAQFRGRSSLTAAAPSIFLASPSAPFPLAILFCDRPLCVPDDSAVPAEAK